MVQESETYRMLPRTKTLLEADIEKRRRELAEISKEGASLWEGDQWHSTAYRQQQQKKELAIRFLQLIDQKGGKIEELAKPEQNDHVEVGHMVKVKLLNDKAVQTAGVPFSLIHVLTKEDAQYLRGEFDNVVEMVVSTDSPMGKGLLGLRRGEVKIYLQEQKLQVIDTEDAISVSYLFEK